MMENVLYVLDTGNNRVQMFQYGSSSEKKRDENKMVPSERPKVAIFDLENSNKEAIDKLMGGAVSEMLTTNFVKSNRFEIVERKELNKILDEQHFNSSGFVSADSAKEIGKLLGIDIGIVGSVSTLTDKIDIDVRMLDMKTGVVILATNKSVKNENKIRDAVSEIVMELERSYINRIGAPSAPTGVISLPSMKSLYIKWDPNPEEDVIGYNIFSSTSAEAKFEKVAEVNKNEYKVDGLNENSTYLFKITAFDSEGKESEFSDLVSVNTKKSPDFGYILNIKYKKLPKKVDFSWTNPEEEIVSSYQIYRAETSDGDYKLVGTSIEKKFEETGLEDGKEYFYKIKKVYPDGLASAFSNYFCCMTDESPNEIQDINAVSNLAKKIEITWKIPETDKDISKIYIFRSDVSGGEFKMINDVTSLRKKYVDNKLNDNTTYYYKLKSVDKFGLESVFSREILATTKDVPATPTNLFAESNLARKVKLTWEYNFMNDQKVYFLVFRASTMNEEFKEIAKLDKTEYIDQKLPDNKQFFYFVTARDTDDLASNPTDIIQAKTKPLPTKPSTLKAMERQPRKVSLVWDKNPEPDIDHYKVYKSKKSQTWYKSIADVKETTYTDDEEKKGLRDNTSYFYKISAVDVDNLESEQSDEISAITKALP
ncbi:MAG: fibronectin type III protein, partial [uncultured bacterium]